MNGLAEPQTSARFNFASPGTESSSLGQIPWKGDREVGSLFIRLHAGMVYGASQRMLGDDGVAMDATRATFLRWLSNARKIKGSMCSWLHRAAVSQGRSLLLDADEELLTPGCPLECVRRNGSEWVRLSPVLDDALAELNDDHHSVLVRHFLQGQMLVEIALADCVSRPAVVCRIEDALRQLRKRLGAKGLVISLPALELQMRKAVTAAPAAVLSELGRLVLSAWTHRAVVPRSQSASVQFSPWLLHRDTN